MIVYHGTSKRSAKNIISKGIQLRYCTLGYFGKGFYTTEDITLAQGNYADYNESDDPGVVLAFDVSSKARLLDLRKENDWEKFKTMNFSELMHREDFPKIMKNAGIDGIYDNSFMGWVFYNVKVLKPLPITIE